MTTIYVILYYLLVGYAMVITVRIIASWIPNVQLGRVGTILHQLTDPYLNWFRRNTPLRVGMLDFSAMIGLIVLYLLAEIVGRLAVQQQLTIVLFGAIVLTRIWLLAHFLVGFFFVLGAARLVVELLGSRTAPFWSYVEQLTDPLMRVIVRPFLRLVRGRFMAYRESLIIYVIVLAAVRLASTFLIDFAGDNGWPVPLSRR